jgi:hypothetical protein
MYAYNFDVTIYDSNWNRFDTVVSHFYPEFISHVIYVMDYLFTAFTFAYLYIACDMLAQGTVCREYLYRMVLSCHIIMHQHHLRLAT